MIKNRCLHRFLFLLVFLVLTRESSARFFKNSYIQFRLPHRWSCGLNNAVWICRYGISSHCQKNPGKPSCKIQIKKSKEAMAIFTAKEASSLDKLNSYLLAFKNPRKIKAVKTSKKTSQSRVIHAKTVNIKNHKWVDAMHLGSEIPHYYTRYLGTVKGNVAVLVTLSSHKLFYTKYSGQFFNSVKSLEILTSNMDRVRKNELGQKVFSTPVEIPDELLNSTGGSMETGETKGDGSKVLFLLAIFLLVSGLFILFKSYKGRSRRGSS